MQSSNYNAGVDGWRMSQDGDAEFASASIRGRLISDQIAVGSILFSHLDPSLINSVAESNVVTFLLM